MGSALFCHVTIMYDDLSRPLFVRLVDQLHLTGTYKLQKTELQNEVNLMGGGVLLHPS
jgi:hypothetical protein